MVGCGAAAAIAGAFGAPLAGAFYAFELIIGGYTPASLTPVGVAAVTGYFVTHGFGALSLGIRVGTVGDVLGRDLAIAALLGLLSGLFGIAIMRGVAACEALLAKIRLWPPLRPALGGLLVGAMALLTPQVMSSGHGALHFTSIVSMPLAFIAAALPPEGDRVDRLARQRFSRRIVFRHAAHGHARRPFVCRRHRYAVARRLRSIRTSMR